MIQRHCKHTASIPFYWHQRLIFTFLTLWLASHFTATAQGNCASPMFAPAKSYPYDNGVSNLKVAEVTGDLYPDLLYFGGGRLVVMPGQANA